jgi:hypothetical protein
VIKTGKRHTRLTTLYPFRDQKTDIAPMITRRLDDLASIT